MFRLTGHQLSEVGSTVEWGTLDAFIKHLPIDSAFMRELQPEISSWATPGRTNTILADIFDMLALINSNLMAMATGAPAKQLKRYPRPRDGQNTQKQNENEKRFGRGGLPANELKRWFEEKRRLHAGSSTGDHNRNTGT